MSIQVDDNQLMAISYLIKVAFPVNGPNLISPYGGWKPNILSASS